MDTMVKTATIICMCCHLERCSTLLPQWWLYTTRRPTPRGIILDMLMTLNGNHCAQYQFFTSQLAILFICLVYDLFVYYSLIIYVLSSRVRHDMKYIFDCSTRQTSEIDLNQHKKRNFLSQSSHFVMCYPMIYCTYCKTSINTNI